jgi:hypothetical protein
VKISEVAGAARVNVQTLRYYERRGLLPEPPRTDSGHRDYDRESVQIVRTRGAHPSFLLAITPASERSPALAAGHPEAVSPGTRRSYQRRPRQ